jgi:hypothetical protein
MTGLFMHYKTGEPPFGMTPNVFNNQTKKPPHKWRLRFQKEVKSQVCKIFKR